LLIGLTTFAVLAGAARCIENDSVYVDHDGYTHIVGNMTNETDVSASTVTLSGRLFDENGNVIAETTAVACPMSVQPHSQNAFDLRFPQPGLPASARYEVRPIAGTTIDHALPASHLTFAQFLAYRGNGTLNAAGFVHNGGSIAYPDAMYCAAAYNADGRVVMVQSSPLEGLLSPGQSLRVPVVWFELPDAATYLVVWVSAGPSEQWIVTDHIPIQNSAPH
jgi:hypothetical protein